MCCARLRSLMLKAEETHGSKKKPKTYPTFTSYCEHRSSKPPQTNVISALNYKLQTFLLLPF